MRSVSGRLHLSTLLSLFVYFLLCYSESNEASPGSQCCQNPPTLDPSSGSGHVEQLGGLSCYIAAASPHSKLAIILVSDVYGDYSWKIVFKSHKNKKHIKRQLIYKIIFSTYYKTFIMFNSAIIKRHLIWHLCFNFAGYEAPNLRYGKMAQIFLCHSLMPSL